MFSTMLSNSENIQLYTTPLSALLYICVFVCVCVYMCMYVCMYIYIYIYSGYGKYSDPLKCFTLCYIAAIC